jgi:OFA family oxalate/formate antiporter-like MFS transporter
VPLTSVLAAKGDWHVVFYAAAAMNIIAALAAVIVLKPLRSAYTSRPGRGVGSATPAPAH